MDFLPGGGEPCCVEKEVALSIEWIATRDYLLDQRNSVMPKPHHHCAEANNVNCQDGVINQGHSAILQKLFCLVVIIVSTIFDYTYAQFLQRNQLSL
jgi:hypothetical protein